MGRMAEIYEEMQEEQSLMQLWKTAREEIEENLNDVTWVKDISKRAAESYADVDTPLSSCLRMYLEEDLKLNEDDAFDLSSDIESAWVVAKFEERKYVQKIV